MLKRIPLMTMLVAALAACATTPEAPDRAPERGGTPEPERRAEPPRREAAVRVGVIVSGGSLKQYGDMVLEGARVAAEAAGASGRGIELVVREDDGTAAGAERALRELEQAGVRAIVGPLMDETLIAAARARSSDNVVLISPTAVADPVAVRNAYALNVVDTRGSAALGEYARRWNTVGVLYSRAPESDRQARAFMEAYSGGGRRVVDAAFAPNATNVVSQVARLREAGVEAIFFPASERELQIVLPQLEHAGLRGVQMLGTESWLGEGARSAPQRLVQGAIVATPLHRESGDVAWLDFVRQYEALHRRSLTSPVAALGFDATVLALRAATSGNAAVTDHRGATGVLSLRSGAVTRRPFLVRIDAGRLIPIN